MANFRSLMREKGLLLFVILVIQRYLTWLQWLIFRLMVKCDPPPPLNTGEFSDRNKDDILLDILRQSASKSFLEIGIGGFPNIQRMKLIIDQKIRYAGCDWKSVCDRYMLKVKAYGLGEDFLFYSNERGNYTWTLFELMQNKEKFDIIYLDGNHTFYIDLPAAALSHVLLKPGGYFILDDITWNLESLKDMLKKDFSCWCFYQKMYNFSEYTKKQRTMYHVKMIAEHYLIEQLNYVLVKELSNASFYVLKKQIQS